MTTALLAHTALGSTTNSTVTTSAIDTTGCNLIVLVASWYTSTITISDSKSNSWTGLTAQSQGAGINLQLYYCLNPTVGTGHTFTNGGSALAASLGVLAFNLDSLSGFDVQNGAMSGATGTTQQPGSITPSTTGSVIVAAGNSDFAGATATVDSSFTLTDTIVTANSQHYGVDTAYLIQSPAAAVNPTFTFSNSSLNMNAVIASFKPGTVVNRRGLYLA